MMRLASAADMPVTVLFGRSPAGMNATGESDRLLWAQTVESAQSIVADPAFTELAALVFASSDGPTRGQVPDAWDVVFPPLVHMTEEQVVKNRKTVAETDAIYIDRGVLLPEEVAMNRFRPTGFSSETTIEVAEREMMLAEEMERLRNPPEPPPQLPPPPTPAVEDEEDDEDRGDSKHLPEHDDDEDEDEDEDRKDGVRLDQGHVHSIPGGGETGPSDTPGQHTHTLPDGRQTGRAPTGAGHTHSVPGGERTGPPRPAD
jgi:hypothetical protein